MKNFPVDYLERVYAGVLGKMVGVYLGRPFEGWSYERILATLGEIQYYVNERMPDKPPLVVTDDDLAGTFVFLRALREHGYDANISSAQIGDTWLNQLIEEKTILWWGGLGNSTEHTAYLRLKEGVRAPYSGSMALNGKILAEQIGGQIFIDSWAMLFPGDPQCAADFARRAASVSHDGEALYGAQVIAAMEALAFVETNIDRLIDTALSLIPSQSILYRMIQDVRGWHAAEPDWHRTRARIAELYGYDRYQGVCHIIPNQAVIMLGLLYGGGDFQRSMSVVNTAGWDTDCNAGNLGCLLGIRSGMSAFSGGPDWLGPIADRLFLVSAEGGEVITDALRTAYEVVNTARRLNGEQAFSPKNGARFHFEGPGARQGFYTEAQDGGSAELENVPGHSRLGKHSLALRWSGKTAVALTPTFILPEERGISWYPFLASPTLYAGQTLQVGILAEKACKAQLALKLYNGQDELEWLYGPVTSFCDGEYRVITWRVPDTHGLPIALAGIEVQTDDAPGGVVYLDYLSWAGAPAIRLGIPPDANAAAGHNALWRRAWVNAVDQWNVFFPEAYRLSQNRGRGLLMQGTRDWKDYEVSAVVRSALLKAGGVALRVQGMRRYYALLFTCEKTARLVKIMDLEEQVLAEKSFAWQPETDYCLRLIANGKRLEAWIDGERIFVVEDDDNPYLCGAAALVIEEGHLACNEVKVSPVQTE